MNANKMIQIANPIYDSVFKYMMQDEKAALCLLKAVLDQNIELLEILPQEHTIASAVRPELSVVRFDYRATIREENGELKKVLIELQKVKRMTNVERFRKYLGENYSQRDLINGKKTSLPITTIYLLGFELAVRRPVIQIGRSYIDPVTKEQVEGTDAFIEALTHDAYFVQIPLLPNKQKTRVERVLAVFSQTFRIDETDATKFYLQLPDDLKNEDNAPLVDRLTYALADPVVKKNAIAEEDFDEILVRELGIEFEKGIERGIERGKAEGERKKAIETAKNFKNLGIPTITIAQGTGLSEEEIESL